MVALSPSLTQKNGLSLRDIPCFHFRDEVRKHVLARQAPTPKWVTAKPCHCKWGYRKDQVQRLCVVAGCSIANTARRKSDSLLHFRTSYVQERALLLTQCCCQGHCAASQRQGPRFYGDGQPQFCTALLIVRLCEGLCRFHE